MFLPWYRGMMKSSSGFVLATVAAFLCATLFPDHAQATFSSVTCAQLDPAQGGAPQTGFFQVTVVVGDRIHVTDPDGTVNYRPPGGVNSTTPSPAQFDVGAGQAGIWRFDLDSNTVECTVGGALPSPQDKSNTNSSLQNTLNQVTPGFLDGNGNPAGGNGASNGNGGAGFALTPSGLGFSRSRIDTNNPLDRQFGAAFAPQGYFAQGDVFTSGKGFRFSADLNSMARASSSAAIGRSRSAANDNADAVLGAGGLKDGPYQPPSRLNPFVSGEYVDFDDDEVNADRNGHLWVVNSGLSFLLSDRTTAGIFARFRDGEVDSTALNASLNSDYAGGGAFLTTTLGGGLRVAIAGYYEDGDNDIRIGTLAGTVTGNFDSQTTTIEGRVDKRITRGRHWIEPAATLRYMETEQDDYTDSSGAFITNQDLTLGRLTYGPKIGTTIQKGNADVRPFAKINGVWDFENEGNFATSTSGVFTSGDHAINLGGGVEVAYTGGMALRLEGNWFAFDTELEGWSLTGGVGAPLSALGLGQVAPAGFVSLDLTGREEGASAKARLRIPLGKAD